MFSSQDERSLLRHARSLEKNACRFERERLREVERDEAKEEAQLIKTTVRGVNGYIEIYCRYNR